MGYEVVAEEVPSCLVTPDVGRTRTGGGGIPSVDANSNKLKAALAATATFDDASTTRTEVSTDIDDMSSLREKLSYGSLYHEYFHSSLDEDGGLFTPPSKSDAAAMLRARSEQSGLLGTVKSSAAASKHRTLSSQGSLLDLDEDLDYDCYEHDATILISNESRGYNFRGGESSSKLATSTVQGESLLSEPSRSKYDSRRIPTGNTYTLESHAQSYGGRGDYARLFPYSRLCSDSEDPLSCEEKIVQVSCEVKLFALY